MLRGRVLLDRVKYHLDQSELCVFSVPAVYSGTLAHGTSGQRPQNRGVRDTRISYASINKYPDQILDQPQANSSTFWHFLSIHEARHQCSQVETHANDRTSVVQLM